jgi:hypothetical protein
MDADEEIAEFFSVKFTGRKMSHEEWQAFLDAELAKCKPEEFGLKILQAANEMHEINFLSEEERCSLPPPARPPARTFIPDALNEASSSVLRPLAAGESCLNLP